MGRKNTRSGTRPQARRSQWGDVPKPLKRPVTAMKLTKVAGRCPGPKRRFRYETKPDAEQALAVVRRERQAKGHPESSIEKRVYECELNGCGGWHLTSREAFYRPPMAHR